MGEVPQQQQQQRQLLSPARNVLFASVDLETEVAPVPLDTPDDAPKASARAVTLNLITGGFGIGMFSLPWSLAGASLIPGVLTILLVVLVNGWTVSILIAGAEKYQAFDLGALLSYLPGGISRPARIATNVAVWVVLFITQVGYVIVMAEAVMSVAGNDTLFKERPAAVVLVSVIVLPLCFLDQRYLNLSSGLSVLVNVFVFAVIASEPKKPEGLCYLGAGLGTLSMISVMMQSIVVQMCVLPMYQELEGRTPETFRRVVRHSFGALSMIFVAFAVMGYVTYGSVVKDNILDALPNTAWGNTARVGAGLGVAGVYPIFEQAMVAPVWNLQSQYRRPFYVMASVATVSLSMITAFFVTSIGFVNVVNGAFCSIIFVALCPSLVGLQLLERRSPLWRTAMYLLLIMGTLSGILGMAFTDNYDEDLMRSCVWHST